MEFKKTSLRLNHRWIVVAFSSHRANRLHCDRTDTAIENAFQDHSAGAKKAGSQYKRISQPVAPSLVGNLTLSLTMTPIFHPYHRNLSARNNNGSPSPKLLMDFALDHSPRQLTGSRQPPDHPSLSSDLSQAGQYVLLL